MASSPQSQGAQKCKKEVELRVPWLLLKEKPCPNYKENIGAWIKKEILASIRKTHWSFQSQWNNWPLSSGGLNNKREI